MQLLPYILLVKLVQCKPRLLRYPSNLFSLCVFRARTSLSDLLLIAPRRQDRKENFLDPPPWRPLRLCESHRLSESLNPNSAENFKYLWTVFIYHEAHEEFTIKLYRPLLFKPRVRYNLISHLCIFGFEASQQTTMVRPLSQLQVDLSAFAEDYGRKSMDECARGTLRSSESEGGCFGGLRRRNEGYHGRKPVEAS